MKTLFSKLNLKLALAGLALSQAPLAFAQLAPDSGAAFHIKSFIKIEHDVTLGVHPKENSESLDNTLLRVRQEAGASVMAAMKPVMRAANDPSAKADARSITLSILQAAGDLADVARRLGIGQPGLAIHMNYVIYPTTLSDKDRDAGITTGQIGEFGPAGKVDNDDAFSKAAIHNIENFKKSKFGRVVDGKLPLLPVAAAVSFRLDGLEGETTIQLLNMVNPQELEGPNPITIPEVTRSADATVMFFEVSQPLKLKLPRIDLKFGKIGSLKRDGYVIHFDVSDNESLCSRTNSAPTLWQKQGLWIPLPLYHVAMDLNKKDAIVDADVRLGFLGSCPSFFGLVRSKFIKQANKQAADAISMVTRLLGATPEEFAEQVNRERKASGLETSIED